MAAGAEDALYEIRRHASGSHAIPPKEGYQGAATSSGGSDAGGGVLSYLSLQGVSKLKERLTRYSVLGGRQRKRGDAVALFVSTNVEPGFYIFTSDCMVHRFDDNQEPEASLCEVPISARTIQLPRSLSCIDYDKRHSQFVLVADSNVSFSSNSYSAPYELNNVKYLDMLEKRLKVAEGHVEVGRLFAYYQVPKPTRFFLSAHLDEKNVKQLIRLLLSKFGRRQPVRSDNEWANMWRDLKLFQEKAFPFLDSEYMLAEFIRGLLKAGKFSLARNYLGGTSAISLSTEKAENLVIQAAREYFFSASTLSGNEIWKARECLNLLPNNKNVQAETDIIDALTVRLPYLGVTILPVQFRQVKDPMEIIRVVIMSQTGAYLHFEEIIDVAKLLGLRSEEEIAAVEEAIAREAVVNDDLDQIDMANTTFWREWKSKLEEEKQLADQARMLKQILPDIDTSQFLSGDANYIKRVVFSFVDSVKLEKKHILKEAVKIAETYGLERTEVLLRFLACSLVSEYWDNNDILNEISEFREDIVKSAKVLEAVLEEWEQLFSPKEEHAPPHESPKETSEWSDGWDDGWEALPEELESTKNKQEGAPLSAHPLHSCWMEIIRKRVETGELHKVIELLDRASLKHSVFLEEEEVHSLVELVSALDCFVALKIVLLLPYEALRLQCLQMVEVKMREGTVSTSSNADDHELLALVLLSGTMQKVTAEEAYSHFFSYLCHLVGHLARSFQTDLLMQWNDEATSKSNRSLLFGRVLFPCFISELVLRGQYLLAGFIVSIWMHTHPSLGLVDIAETSVRQFLQGQVAQAEQSGGGDASFTDGEVSVKHTISTLQLKLESVLQAALSALPNQEL
nr:unnamed protein product [Digitaria exilis]